MKTGRFYSEEFKKAVVQEVLSGQINKTEARRKYGIRGSSLIIYWIRKFDPKSGKMKKRNQLKETELSRLEIENRRLREELEMERLKTLSLNIMIDFAEKEFNIPIRKKPGVKQLKK